MVIDWTKTGNVISMKTNEKCRRCPPGGVCAGGTNIVPDDNQWGYMNSKGLVNFVPCVENSCCSSSECKVRKHYGVCPAGKEEDTLELKKKEFKRMKVAEIKDNDLRKA